MLNFCEKKSKPQINWNKWKIYVGRIKVSPNDKLLIQK